MDLLYALQTIRTAFPEWIVFFISAFSDSVILLAPVISFFTFWTIDKKKGSYMFVSLAAALLLNELIKVTFCVYRPWILDARLTPAVQAVGMATNYSFPSSHSCASASVCASLAFAFPGHKKRTVITSILVILILFSRMFLGCHTLADVCTGAIIGSIMSIIMRPMLSDTFDANRFAKIFLPVSICLAFFSVIYILNKTYPLDYAPDKSLIVDPRDMFPDTVASCGSIAGLGIGMFLEQKFIGFPMSASKKETILRCTVGAFCFALMYVVILKMLFLVMDPSSAKFLRNFICVLIFTAAYPALFKTRLFKVRQDKHTVSIH